MPPKGSTEQYERQRKDDSVDDRRDVRLRCVERREEERTDEGHSGGQYPARQSREHCCAHDRKTEQRGPGHGDRHADDQIVTRHLSAEEKSEGEEPQGRPP